MLGLLTFTILTIVPGLLGWLFYGYIFWRIFICNAIAALLVLGLLELFNALEQHSKN